MWSPFRLQWLDSLQLSTVQHVCCLSQVSYGTQILIDDAQSQKTEVSLPAGTEKGSHPIRRAHKPRALKFSKNGTTYGTECHLDEWEPSQTHTPACSQKCIQEWSLLPWLPGYYPSVRESRMPPDCNFHCIIFWNSYVHNTKDSWETLKVLYAVTGSSVHRSVAD